MAKNKAKGVKIPKVRAIELYSAHTPFKPKVVKSKLVYNRNKMKNFDK